MFKEVLGSINRLIHILKVFTSGKGKRIRLAALLIVLLLAVKLNHIRADVFGSKEKI